MEEVKFDLDTIDKTFTKYKKNEIFDGFRGVLIKLFSKKANYIVANSENGKKMWEKK